MHFCALEAQLSNNLHNVVSVKEHGHSEVTWLLSIWLPGRDRKAKYSARRDDASCESVRKRSATSNKNCVRGEIDVLLRTSSDLHPACGDEAVADSLFVKLVATLGEAHDTTNFFFDVTFVAQLGHHLTSGGRVDRGLRQLDELTGVLFVAFGQIDDESLAQRGF